MNIFQIIAVLALLQIALCLEYQSPFWPQPSSFTLGNEELMLSSIFEFRQEQETKSDLLQRGFDRYHQVYADYRKETPSAEEGKDVIPFCSINVENILDSDAEKSSLDIDVDESYTLDITQQSSRWECSIKSSTVWGALHALETFTQLLTRYGDNFTFIGLNYAPVTVQDSPRFTHRGLLIDSARHYLPIDTILMMIDSLVLVKMNILHWHFEDAESFPMDTPSAPEMIKAAFRPSDIYSMEQVKMIDDYATDLGIRIIYEVDGPGHGASYIHGYPELVPAKCIDHYSYNINDYAINPTLNKTYEILGGILSDIHTATGTKYIHLGGDEVVFGCWGIDDQINAYMEENNIATYQDLLGVYTEKAQDIAKSLDMSPIQWEDTFIAGVRPSLNTIFDVWTNSTQVKAVTDAGYRVIAGPSNYWYLDHLHIDWLDMWLYDPTDDIPENNIKLIIGGEASCFDETVNQYNIQNRVWPRTAAVAERLWSTVESTPKNSISDATNRLNIWICRQNSRGFFSGPIQPGYCPEKLV